MNNRQFEEWLYERISEGDLGDVGLFAREGLLSNAMKLKACIKACEIGNKDVYDMLIQDDYISSFRIMLIEYAVKGGNFDIIKSLVHRNDDVDLNVIQKAIRFAVEHKTEMVLQIKSLLKPLPLIRRVEKLENQVRLLEEFISKDVSSILSERPIFVLDEVVVIDDEEYVSVPEKHDEPIELT